MIDTSLQMVRDAVAYVGVMGLKYGQTPIDAGMESARTFSHGTRIQRSDATRNGRSYFLPWLTIIRSRKRTSKSTRTSARSSTLSRTGKAHAGRQRSRSHLRHLRKPGRLLDAMSASPSAIWFASFERAAPDETSNAAPAALRVISNIPINIPFHFVGRDMTLLRSKRPERNDGRPAISVLHGMRGVGKTTLAATYAVRHRDKYRATWWIKAETESTMRADLSGLGVQLGWIAADAPEEKSVEAVLDRLGFEGEGILLVYDNAIGAKEFTTSSRAVLDPELSSRPMLRIGAPLPLQSKSMCGRRTRAPIFSWHAPAARQNARLH